MNAVAAYSAQDRAWAVKRAQKAGRYDVIDIDGVRANFGYGWGLVRASNTQPSLVLRCEADSEQRLAAIRKILESEIERAQAAN